VGSQEPRNIWRELGNLKHYFNFGWHEMLWEISWNNILMLGASMPKSKPGNKQENEYNDAESVNASDTSAIYKMFG